MFKNNNSIVKVNHRDNGFEDEGNSYVFFKNVADVGGISSTTLNSLLYKVTNSGIDSYNITSISRAGSSVLGGGSNVLATYNRKFEKLFAHISYLQFEGTTIDTFVKTTNVKPVDSSSINFPSYTQTDYERTFLNQEHFFTNQKLIASRINETLNNIKNSLLYKVNLKSSVSYLSPVIDLNTSSVKTSTNRVENSTGFEDRYGKRYQILKFLPLYNLSLTLVGNENNLSSLAAGQTVIGKTSKAEATIVSIDGNVFLVKLRTDTTFQASEQIDFATPAGVKVSGVSASVISSNEVTFNFSENANVYAVYPFNANIEYSNKINGKVISWDSRDKELVVENSYAPISNDYTNATTGSPFVRLEEDQQPDIFRVGDVLLTNEDTYVEVSSMEYSTGVDYIPEDSSKNTSALAKYVSKEVYINNPGTSINIKLTANVKNTENILVLYKIKESSLETNFEDINWKYFNVNGTSDNNDLATPENTISGLYEKQSSYQEFSYTINDLPEFTSFAIKLVMKTDDPAYAPKLQDVRAVASY